MIGTHLHSFYRGKSSLSNNLLELFEDFNKTMNKDKVIVIIYLDILKYDYTWVWL